MNFMTIPASATQLSVMPSQIANLTNLSILNLENNKLTSIQFITPLHKLTVLNVSGNSLTELEPAATLFAGLTNLVSLDLSCNDLSDVPSQLGHLTSLKTLELEGNGIRSIRRAILEKGTAAILQYLRER
jgi:Leucine-rich repeat (LRR) protein